MGSLLRTLVLIFVLTVFWQAICATSDLPAQLLPTPSSVVTALGNQILAPDFWEDLGISVTRVWSGFLLSLAFAVPFALAMSWSKKFRQTYGAINNYVRYLPVAALIPLLILWLGIGFQQKLAVIFIGTFFQLTVMLQDNFRNVPEGYLEAARWTGARRASQQIWRVILPYKLPYVIDDMKVALGWAWSYLLVAEIVAADRGIGFKIIQAMRFLKTSELLGLIIVVGAIGVGFDMAFDTLNRRAFRWRNLEDFSSR